MAQNETWLKHDLLDAVKVQYLDGNLFSMDNAGNLIGVTLTRDGEDYSGGGSVSANVIRSDGGTVAVSGALSGKTATVVLPQAAYAVPGVVSIIVKLTASGQVTTIAALVANVYRSSTDTAVDPGTIIPSIQTLISQINTAVASIPADYSALWTKLAPAFSTDASYVAGQYVTYNSGLYRFNTSHSGSWSSSDVTAVNLGGEITDLKSAFNVSVDQINSEKIFDNYIKDYTDFEIGFIQISNSGWNYVNNTKAVRTKQGTTLSLKKGDRIYLKDYTDARIYIGWLANGTYGSQYWVTGGIFTCSTDGEYVLVLMNKTEAVQSGINALVDLLVIESCEARVKTLEGIVSEDVNALDKSIRIINRDSVLDDYVINYSDFDIGNISVSNSGWTYGSSTTRVRTKQGKTLSLKQGDRIKLSDYTDAKFAVGWLANGTYGAYYWVQSGTYTCTVNGQYVLVLVNKTEATQTSINDLLDLLIIEHVVGRVKTLEDSVSIINELLPNFKFQNKGNKSVTFSDYYNNVDNMLFCCSNIKCISSTATYEGLTLTLYPSIKNRNLCFKATRDYTGNLFAYRMIAYDSEDSQLAYKSTTTDGTLLKVFITKNVAKVVIEIATNWSASVVADVEYNISDIELYYDEGFDNSVGNGEYEYYGMQKLALIKNTYQMRKEDIKTYLQSEWTSLTDEDYGTNQSFAMFGGWMFIINEGIKSIVYDVENDASYVISLADGHHHNSAQFLDVYYDDGDEFPLLMVSNCQFNIPDATISVYRITRSGTTFTATLVKTIALDIYEPKNYGFSAVFDTQRRKLIVFYNTKGNWQVSPDNPVNMSEFAEPDWDDSSTTTYTSSDETVLNTFPFFIVQGIAYFNGLYYLATAITGTAGFYRDVIGLDVYNYVFVFNPTGELLNMIPTSTHEAEGTAISNGSLFLSSRNWNYEGTPTETVCWITKFDFD